MSTCVLAKDLVVQKASTRMGSASVARPERSVSQGQRIRADAFQCFELVCGGSQISRPSQLCISAEVVSDSQVCNPALVVETIHAFPISGSQAVLIHVFCHSSGIGSY